ncbi:MAG: hypothetical protein DRN99_06270 [Thermoproteota archaeon]|nr:MAG: hypothetical protein DRN99_06270 [Candidatus Korarchaeota archaeon]
MVHILSITLVLPKRASSALAERARVEGVSIEELDAELLLEKLDAADPDAKAELHLKLCERYLSEAEAYLSKGDYVQASEKAWGAASQAVKAIAAKRGAILRSHRDLWKFITELSKERREWKLIEMFHIANSLHVNFYENWLTAEAVERGIGAVKLFVKKLIKLLEQTAET